MKRLDERGNVIFPACFVLAMTVVLLCLMLWMSSQITMMNVRNEIKNELANVSIRISEDTYAAMSEGSLASYYAVLSSDRVYQNELKQIVVNGIKSTMDMENDNYKVSDISLDFIKHDDSIEYVLTCNIEYYLSFLGDSRTIKTEDVRLTARHNIKSY